MPPKSSLQGSLEEAEKASKQATSLCDQMLTYAGNKDFSLEPVELNQLVADTTHLVNGKHLQDVHVATELDPHLPTINADPARLRQIILNLALNAAEAIEGRKDGTIRMKSGEGSRFTLLLPKDHPTVGSVPSTLPSEISQAQATIPSGNKKILIIDDEPSLRTACELLLVVIGFQTLSAANGNDGIEIFSERRDEIYCVLLDLTMPTLSGAETMAELRKLDPHFHILWMGGYDEDKALRHVSDASRRFTQKPFVVDDLKAKLFSFAASDGLVADVHAK